jgi:hypothetical protein
MAKVIFKFEKEKDFEKLLEKCIDYLKKEKNC